MTVDPRLEVEAVKPSDFNHFVTSLHGSEILYFNARTGYFTAMGESEWEQISEALEDLDAPRDEDMETFMRNSGMIVPAGYDEREAMRETYLNSKETKGLMLTITTTISCNFGCNYCFQSHSKEQMEDVDEAAILAVVEKHLPENTYLNITWFGGEPLTNFNLVENLAPKLEALAKERGSRYSHSIITNGFLLTDKMVERMRALTRMSFIQVTLDGGQEHHDVRRVLLSGKGTYKRILDNVERAADVAPIHIRVNVDKTNVDGIEAVVDDYFERGLKDRGVQIYLAHTRAYTEASASVKDVALSKEEFADLSMQFDFFMFQRGLGRTAQLPKPRHGTLCTADSQNSYVLSPKGRVFKCWNDAASTDTKSLAGLMDAQGEITHFEENRSYWEDHDPYGFEACKTCSVQPLCKGGCPWEAKKHDAKIGDCSAYRWNLADTLRLYHLQQGLSQIEIDRDLQPSDMAGCP